MITLTAYENRLRRVLIQGATDAQPKDPTTACCSYSYLALQARPDEQTGPIPRRYLGGKLFHVNRHELERGRPMLGALVVGENFGEPGEGFYECVNDLANRGLCKPIDGGDTTEYWQAELNRCIRYWQSDAALLADSIDRIMAELATVKKRLG